jgi:hypothetical protein
MKKRESMVQMPDTLLCLIETVIVDRGIPADLIGGGGACRSHQMGRHTNCWVAIVAPPDGSL